MAWGTDVDRLNVTAHAVLRMRERRITMDEVGYVVRFGEVIESYPDARPFPAELLLGVVNGRTLHVVFSEDRTERIGHVITAYDPSVERWEADFRRRRR